MKVFSGFPAGKVNTVALPDPLFSELLPMVDDLGELKLTLHALWRLGQQRGPVRFLRHADLLADDLLRSSLAGGEASAVEAVERALQRAVERGTLLRVETAPAAGGDVLYFANTPRGRAAADAIARGRQLDELEPADRPDIFILYEQNIGLLTPLVAEELRQAEKEYPAEWVADAFREAVRQNVRKWSYVRAILERWRDEGKEDDRIRRNKHTDWRYYVEGQ